MDRDQQDQLKRQAQNRQFWSLALTLGAVVAFLLLAALQL